MIMDTTQKEGTIIFVTIGLPFSNIPIMQKVMIYVELDGSKDLHSHVDAAKVLRNIVAENLEMHGFQKREKFTPEELYYEIYGSVENQIPFACSANSKALILAA